MSKILLVSVCQTADSILQRYCDGQQVDVARAASVEEALDMLNAGNDVYDSVVVESFDDQLVQSIQSLSTAARHVSMLVLGAKDNLPLIQRYLKVAPINADIQPCSNSDPHELRTKTADAIQRSRHRREFRAEIELVRSSRKSSAPRGNELLDRLLNHAPVGVILIDPFLTVVAINREGERLLQIDEKQALGKRLIDFFHPNEVVRLSEYVQSGFGSQRLPPDIFELPGAEPRIFEVTVSIVSRASDSFSAMVLLNDVTRRQLAERELRAARDTLEERVKQRTAELARSNADLEEFAYAVSHDLQEPLRSVSGFCDLLQRRCSDQLDERGLKYIEYTVASANRMQIMIGELLEFSRLGRLPVNRVTIDVNELIRDAMVNLDLAIRANDAEFDIGDLPTISADRTQMLQIFQNLISNAIKFRGDEPPRIVIRGETTDTGWKFQVKDNGIGLAPKFYKRIFAIFQRLHTQEEIQGTGVGLALCKKIVKRHGGTIGVESMPGEGCTFTFEIANPAKPAE